MYSEVEEIECGEAERFIVRGACSMRRMGLARGSRGAQKRYVVNRNLYVPFGEERWERSGAVLQSTLGTVQSVYFPFERGRRDYTGS